MGENLKISIFFFGSPQNIQIVFGSRPPPPSDNKIFPPSKDSLKPCSGNEREREILKDDFINIWTLSCRQININAWHWEVDYNLSLF